MTKSEKSKRRHSIEAIFKHNSWAVKVGDVSSDNGAVFNLEARLAANIPRHRDACRLLQKMPASFGYKSQRRNRTQGEKKERGYSVREERKPREGERKE